MHKQVEAATWFNKESETERESKLGEKEKEERNK
jgi:hypothetical protein